MAQPAQADTTPICAGEAVAMKLVFIHGAGGGAYSWYRQKEYFGERADPISLPGHPEGLGEKQIAPYVTWGQRVRPAPGLSGRLLVGHSIGGAITQAIALSTGAKERHESVR